MSGERGTYEVRVRYKQHWMHIRVSGETEQGAARLAQVSLALQCRAWWFKVQVEEIKRVDKPP